MYISKKHYNLGGIKMSQTKKEWLWPCAYTTNITPGRDYNSNHNGLDITAGDIFGAPVFASKAGTVEIVYTGCENHNAATTLIGCSADITKCSCNNLRKSNTYNIMLCNYTMGNAVIIKHPETDAQGKDISKYSQYLHLSSIAPDIVVGKNVRQG